ncbi:MAG: oxygen-independent coproporphyrinogen III oxidase [Parvularculaceae bacterium]|nr:oxygen-independent coproporphyrinogen III oxidase [Caulobacterales bacterium]
MKQAWRKYLAARAPRYTSYPSALQFSTAVDDKVYQEALSRVSLYEPISIYVHVPFCKQLCWYCGCNMRVENHYDRALDYVDSLIGETRLVSAALAGRGRPSSVHFGGGTPNYLETDEIARILDAIECEFGLTDDARLAIELDPRLIKRGHLAELARLGFSRVSFGVQDFDPDVQLAINRVQSFELIESCVCDAREAGIEDVSFDLLYGLPRQTPATFAATIEKTIALGPDRVSIFGYAHLPAALPRQRMIRDRELPDTDGRAELSLMADEKLVAAGYGRIGFDHYAKPGNSLFSAACAGALRRNFQGFTDDVATTMIGLGASAISFASGVYAQNAKTVKQYAACIAEGRLPTERGVVRTERDEAYAKLIAELLCQRDADLEEAGRILSGGEIDNIKQCVMPFVRDGVVTFDAARIRMAPGARELSRAVAAAFDPYAGAAPALARVV